MPVDITELHIQSNDAWFRSCTYTSLSIKRVQPDSLRQSLSVHVYALKQPTEQTCLLYASQGGADSVPNRCARKKNTINNNMRWGAVGSSSARSDQNG